MTKAKEVTAAVIDIIGLDYNQFSQIAMIAQGQFTRLLNATTEERSKIFRKLFRTQRYQKLQEALAEENSAPHGPARRPERKAGRSACGHLV